MIRVIKMGSKQSRTCYACGCYFNFSNEDIRDIDEETFKGTIVCPQCGKIITAKAVIMPDESEKEVLESDISSSVGNIGTFDE